MSNNYKNIFKIAIFAHHDDLINHLLQKNKIFGIDFEASFTQTKGAGFAYSHFFIDDQRLTGQFWVFDANPQWHLVRNLYLKGVSGIILLFDEKKKNNFENCNRLLSEFMTVSRFYVPIIIINVNRDEKSKSDADKYKKSIERWLGYQVNIINFYDVEEIDLDLFSEFMRNVRDWNAKNIIFQTLKIYFRLDSINREKRSLKIIAMQLRKIYTSRYYSLISDEKLIDIVKECALNEGFKIDTDSILYQKEVRSDPFILYDFQDEVNIDRPKISKL